MCGSIMNTSMDKKGKDKASVLDMPIDPNEPTYCICNQVSFGDMIAVSVHLRFKYRSTLYLLATFSLRYVIV